MCSLKFLLLVIVCIEIIGGEVYHEEETRQPRAEPTTSEYMFTSCILYLAR